MGPLTPKFAVATVGCVTDSTADLDAPPYVAMIVAGSVPPTTRVEIMNVALVDPAGTITLSGTFAGSPPESDTAAPPVCAAPVKVTVAVVDPPPTIDVSPSVRPDTATDAAGGVVVVGGAVEGGFEGAVGELPHRALKNAARTTAVSVVSDFIRNRGVVITNGLLINIGASV